MIWHALGECFWNLYTNHLLKIDGFLKGWLLNITPLKDLKSCRQRQSVWLNQCASKKSYCSSLIDIFLKNSLTCWPDCFGLWYRVIIFTDPFDNISQDYSIAGLELARVPRVPGTRQNSEHHLWHPRILWYLILKGTRRAHSICKWLSSVSNS